MIKRERVCGGASERQDVCVQSESGIRTFQRHTLHQRKSFWVKSAVPCFCSKCFTLTVQEMIHLFLFCVRVALHVCNLDDLQVC